MIQLNELKADMQQLFSASEEEGEGAGGDASGLQREHQRLLMEGLRMTGVGKVGSGPLTDIRQGKG